MKAQGFLIGIFAVLAMSVAIGQLDNETNETNYTTQNVTDINETNFTDMNATNLTEVNESVINDTNLSNDTNVTDVNESVLNDTNETTANLTNETYETAINESANETANASMNESLQVNLYVKKWYPKGPDYVFVCNATGFTPIAYSWFYGDGHKLINISNGDTYHVYEEAGNYTVSCSATDGENTASSAIDIKVNATERPGHENDSTTVQGSAPKVNLSIKKWYPKGPDYVFVCNASGFTPTAYSWFYGDGHKLINISNGDTYHVYEQLGQYTVMCTATDGDTFVTDTLEIKVTSLTRPGIEPNQSTSVNETPVNNESNETNATENVSVFNAVLNGTNEVPPVSESNATGKANATLDGSILFVWGEFANLGSSLETLGGSPGHIHVGLPGEFGPAIFPLDVFSEDELSGTFNLTVGLTEGQIEALANGSYYINIHTNNYPNGEIRGQIVQK